MKIGSYVPKDKKIENIEVFRGCQSLLFKLQIQGLATINQLGVIMPKLNVALMNTLTGSQQTLIPYIALNKLAEISTFNEGSILLRESEIVLPVLLSPEGNVKMSNSVYMQLSLIDIDASITGIDIYAFETGINSEFITKYSKMNCPSGSSRTFFNVYDNDLIALPINSTNEFDSLMITYKNGLVASYSKTDLLYYMCQNNDMTAFSYLDNPASAYKGLRIQVSNLHNELPATYDLFKDSMANAGTLTLDGSAQQLNAFGSQYIFNLVDVASVEVIRDSDSEFAYEFILADFQTINK